MRLRSYRLICFLRYYESAEGLLGKAVRTTIQFFVASQFVTVSSSDMPYDDIYFGGEELTEPLAEQFMPKLSAWERDSYYHDSKRLGHLLGLKPADLPQDYPAFERYYNGMLCGEELAVTPTIAALADQIIHPPISWVPRVAGDVLSIATAALMPPQLRSLYGLKWSSRRQFAWRAARKSLREALPYVPDVVRAGRRARRGERIVRAARLSA